MYSVAICGEFLSTMSHSYTGPSGAIDSRGFDALDLDVLLELLFFEEEVEEEEEVVVAMAEVGSSEARCN
jgi:hypothetical protein